jgi:tripartite-type tricarboxylate transporter receptor subunit TctC
MLASIRWEDIMKRIGLLPLVAIGLALATFDARAQTWPAKPLKAIVPVAAGSLADIVPRIVFEQLSGELGQPIVVENRAGAGTTLGSTLAAKADADGYTLLATSSAHAIAPALHTKLTYDPGRDFVAVASLGVTPFVLVVPPDRGFKTIGDFVAATRSKPGSFNFASVGAGTASHLSAELFMRSAGIKATHVAFKGGPEAMTEVIAGRIDFYFVALGAALSQIREGKLIALAVNGATRAPALPDVPILDEAGISGAAYPTWFGLFLPAKTPHGIVEKLHALTMKALRDPKVQGKLSALGVDGMPLKPDEFDVVVRKEILTAAELVKSLSLKVN